MESILGKQAKQQKYYNRSKAPRAAKGRQQGETSAIHSQTEKLDRWTSSKKVRPHSCEVLADGKMRVRN